MKPLCTAETARLSFTFCYCYFCYNLFYSSCNRNFLYSCNHPKRFQVRSVAHSCPTLCEPMDCSIPGLPVHHQLLELTQTHVHLVGDAIQPSHPLVPFSSHLQSFTALGSFPINQFFSSVAKILEFQLQHQSFQ